MANWSEPREIKLSKIRYGDRPDKRGERTDKYGKLPILVKWSSWHGQYVLIDGNDRLYYANQRDDSHIMAEVPGMSWFGRRASASSTSKKKGGPGRVASNPRPACNTSNKADDLSGTSTEKTELITMTQQIPVGPAYSPPPADWSPQRPEPKNGFGITALVAAMVGIVPGLMPITSFFAVMFGVVAVLFGLLGLGRVRRGVATNRRLTWTGTIVGVLVIALGIWGITLFFGALGKLDNAISGAAPTTSNSSSAGGSDSAAGSDSTTLAFGQRTSWPDGTAVTVSEPKRYTPSDTAATTGGSARFVVVTVTIENQGQKNLNASDFTLAASANGEQADRVFDTANNVAGEPNTVVLPGKKATYRAAFGLTTAGPAELQVQATPSFGFGYKPAIYVGTF